MRSIERLRELSAVVTDDCVLWDRGRFKAGYGAVAIPNTRKVAAAHRLSCEWAHGAPFDGAEAAHACGVPACVNPRHLRWATPAENMADKSLHGTQPSGETIWNSMSEADVQQIVSLLGTASQRVIAAKFGVHQMTVSRISRGQHWSQKRSKP